MLESLNSVEGAMLGACITAVTACAAALGGAFITIRARTRDMILDKAIAAGINEHRAVLDAVFNGAAVAPPPPLSYYIFANIVFFYKLHGMEPPSIEEMLKASECEVKTSKELLERFTQ